MARCWVLRKRAGLVLLSVVVCAVRMLAVVVGLGCRCSRGCCCARRFWVRPVALSPALWGGGVAGRSGVWVWWVARAVGHRTALLVAWVGSFGATSGRLVG